MKQISVVKFMENSKIKYAVTEDGTRHEINEAQIDGLWNRWVGMMGVEKEWDGEFTIFHFPEDNPQVFNI